MNNLLHRYFLIVYYRTLRLLRLFFPFPILFTYTCTCFHLHEILSVQYMHKNINISLRKKTDKLYTQYRLPGFTNWYLCIFKKFYSYLYYCKFSKQLSDNRTSTLTWFQCLKSSVGPCVGWYPFSSCQTSNQSTMQNTGAEGSKTYMVPSSRTVALQTDRSVNKNFSGELQFCI